jgi:Tol biopolymer transport system component
VIATVALAGLSSAQVTERVSLSANGSEAIVGADLQPSDRLVSDDGRFVIFRSWSWNLVPGDTNIAPDVFLRDRLLGTTERISVSSSGVQGNDGSGIFGYAISPDGRYVVFYSEASNLVPGDVNNAADVFLRDRLNGTTELVSLDSSAGQGNAKSEYPCISADGRHVAFDSLATNLVPGDTNGKADVFLRDLWTGQTQRVSVSSSGSQSNGDSMAPSISADGRYVAFHSNGNNLVSGDTNTTWDVFVYDRVNGTQELISISTGGTSGNNQSGWPHLSGDGRFVCFDSYASNLFNGDTNGGSDALVRDRLTGITELASVNSLGIQANAGSGNTHISPDGQFVLFASYATNLDPSGTPPGGSYVHDRRIGSTERVSISNSGQPAMGAGGPFSISLDGRYAVFANEDPNLVSGDTNNAMDVYVHDRHSSGFTSLCDPGTNNVIACPCSNAPSARSRGCDNSSFTGGAALTSSGIAYLSLDSLVFTTHDEKPSATSLLLQGDALMANGVAFGQGVRCAGGALRRLYLKTASNGSMTAPDFSVGDPTVSARSAFLGAPIQPGQPYYYLVYYRDPVVLGGCSAGSTFNATQSGQVSWWP